VSAFDLRPVRSFFSSFTCGPPTSIPFTNGDIRVKLWPFLRDGVFVFPTLFGCQKRAFGFFSAAGIQQKNKEQRVTALVEVEGASPHIVGSYLQMIRASTLSP
jgi:hypothetical protein